MEQTIFYWEFGDYKTAMQTQRYYAALGIAQDGESLRVRATTGVPGLYRFWRREYAIAPDQKLVYDWWYGSIEIDGQGNGRLVLEREECLGAGERLQRLAPGQYEFTVANIPAEVAHSIARHIARYAADVVNEVPPSIWVDEWKNWPKGDAEIWHTVREGCPGRCTTGGDYYFYHVYHVYPGRGLVVKAYHTSADFFYCPGCGSFVRDGEWARHQEFCRMETQPLRAWVAEHRGMVVECDECYRTTTIGELADAGWACSECKHTRFNRVSS